MFLKMVGRHLAYFLLQFIMLALVVQGRSDKSALCSDFGGECLPASESNNCNAKANLARCEVDEICCLSSDSSNGRQADQCKPTPARCKKFFKGKCLSECPDNRIAVETCRENCTCCGCEIKDECKDNHGFCNLKWRRCEGTKENGWCKGKRCTCCVPDCPETERCTEAGGYCNKTCGEKERPHQTIKCINSDKNGCQCCVPEGRCPQNDECRSVRGKCRDACRFPFEQVSSQAKCDAGGCVCCVLKILTIGPCKQAKECHEIGGRCRKICLLGSALNATCPDSGCKCCKRILPFKEPEPLNP